MVFSTLHIVLVTVGIVFLIIDILIVVAVVSYCLWRKRNKRTDNTAAQVPLIEFPEKPWIRPPINYSPGLFEIPTLNGNSKRDSLTHKIDKTQYPKLAKRRSRKNIPSLCFELSYNFRKSALEVFLLCGKSLPGSFHQQVIVSVSMSHTTDFYSTDRFDGGDPDFKKEFSFPLEDVQISSDPPITIRFNVWTIDKYSRKDPFGYVESNIEEILTKYGLNPIRGEAPVWRNIIKSDELVNESVSGEAHISLSYLPGAQRISLSLLKAKDLVLSTADKEIFAKLTFLHQDRIQKTLNSEAIPINTEPEFNQEFIFNLLQHDNVAIDKVTIEIEILCKQNKMFLKPRVLGKIILGNTAPYKSGREHWAMMLISLTSVAKWHYLDAVSDE